MKKSRALDQRRYDYERIVGRKCTEEERELLKEYTVKELKTLIKCGLVKGVKA